MPVPANKIMHVINTVFVVLFISILLPIGKKRNKKGQVHQRTILQLLGPRDCLKQNLAPFRFRYAQILLQLLILSLYQNRDICQSLIILSFRKICSRRFDVSVFLIVYTLNHNTKKARTNRASVCIISQLMILKHS